ncbi:hypothetical protein DSL72_006232 [Monilinia vaccinii-corymbosi]|uniref:Uncharacterized protein n=1 Tax=Monilinia vaccinii-corymbosi TaxID=61207 RepID=A0A8A3PNE7_9HELO|nr:hypothetical protein DSL72_006232 [Monilinia vaccinii-corymbosi]
MLGQPFKSLAKKPVPSQGQVHDPGFHARYSHYDGYRLLNPYPQQGNLPPSSPIALQPLGLQSPSYSSPYPSPNANPGGVPLQRPNPPFHSSYTTPYPQNSIPPSSTLPSSQNPSVQNPSVPNPSVSTPVPPSKLQALPQSQSLESALDDADLESLKALLRASGNLYPHMRTTALRFLLGHKYVEEERKEGWTIEGLVDKGKVGGSSASVEKGKENLSIIGGGGKAREKSVNLGKAQIVPGKGLVIDLVSDDEDSSQQENVDRERNVGAERRLAKPWGEERQETQGITPKVWENEKQRNELEVEAAFAKEKVRRLEAELESIEEGQRKRKVEKELEEANQRTEQAQSAFAKEQRMRLSQEKVWMEDQHLIEHYKKGRMELKSLASAAQQYINVLETGCNASMLEMARAGTSSKRWTEMYEKIYDMGDKSSEIAQKSGSVENVNTLEEALMMEKKKRATVQAELEAAREEINIVIKNYESEWRQVESLQKQVSELEAKAIDSEKILNELKARNDTVECSLQVEKARSEWFKEQFADQQRITIDKEDLSTELKVEKVRREAAEKMVLEIEKKLKEITEKASNNESIKVCRDPGVGLKDKTEKALAEGKEEDLNGRAQSQGVASEPSSSKKRKLNPTLEEFWTEEGNYQI